MYGKIFEQIYDGTLATKGPWQALVTFQQLIILADKHGVVDMTEEALARRTTIPIEIIQNGIAALVEPDPDSRTPTMDGKRIVLISPARSWGWRIVNYEHYRKIRSEEERRDYHRRYYHDERKGKSQQFSTSQHNSTDSTNSTDYTEAVSSKQEAKEKKGKAARKRATPLPEAFQISDRVKTWAQQKGYSGLEAYLEFFTGRMKANGKAYVDWDEAFMNCIREDWPDFRKQSALPDYSGVAERIKD